MLYHNFLTGPGHDVKRYPNGIRLDNREVFPYTKSLDQAFSAVFYRF